MMGLHTFKGFVSRLTLPLGFTVQRVPPLRRWRLSGKEAPVYIEFVGASGVGKTTLYRTLSKGSRVNWIDIRHFVAMKSHKQREGSMDALSFYQSLADYRMKEVLESRENALPADRLGACRNAYNALRQDAMVYLFNRQEVVLSDEGLFQFFSQSVKKLYAEKQKEFAALLRGRAVVYCTASAEVITERILKRAERTGYFWYQHKTVSREDLMSVVQHTLEEKEQLITILRDYIPVLELQTADPTAENKRKVKAFIKACQQDDGIRSYSR